MTNITQISSISLSFNDSWFAHIGSRIYRIAIETIELLGTVFSCSFVQPYSGKRLYQLVDTYRGSINNRELYDEARSSYATSIITALEDERNIFEKTKRVRTILNTHIIGLSILQAKDKKALSEHVAYTLLPSLIDEFGAKMARKSILALYELDNTDQLKSDNDYARLYRDIALQQSDLDSFVEALQELNSDVSKDILIHELLLSRNRNLTDTAKDKIISTLKSGHYIDIKVQKKLQLLKQLKSQSQDTELSKSEITLELQSHRDVQVESLHYKVSSMFFGSIAAPFIEKSGDVSYGCLEDQNPIPESSSLNMTAQPTKEILSSEIPIGISNFDQSCWYNSALQVMNNTPLYGDIIQQKDKFSTDFPKIAESLNLYRNTPRLDEKKNHNQLHLDNQMEGIRQEIRAKIDTEVRTGPTQEDSKLFLTHLLEELSIDTYFIFIINEGDICNIKDNSKDNALNKQNKYLLVEVRRELTIDLHLFTNTKYQPQGIIFHMGGDNSGHYTAAVKKGQSWYLCDDNLIEEVSEAEVNNRLQDNKIQAFIIASRKE